MPHFQINNRWTGATLFEGNFVTMRLFVENAARARANLVGANLAGADLTNANLAGANLARAYLVGANLAGADLTNANLARADLTNANLAGANLAGAYLARANLADATIGNGVRVRVLRKVCSRTDGYQFLLWGCEDGAWRVQAGCRFFALPEAWKHWTRTRDGTPLGEETFDILVMFEHQVERDDAARKEQA